MVDHSQGSSAADGMTLNKGMQRGLISPRCRLIGAKGDKAAFIQYTYASKTAARWQISAWRSVIAHDTSRRAFLEAAVS